MNKSARFFSAVTLVAGLSLLGGCGGGGGGGGDQLAGIDRLGVSVGSVSGFGSIVVNGVRYETTSSSFDVDDNASGSSQDDLSVGDVVVVSFDPDAPTVAVSVVSDEAVEGPVTSVDAAAGVLVVVGQTVLVDAATSYDDGSGLQSVNDIQVGNFLEISGFFDADGAIRATRIERKPPGGVIEVHGVVTGKTANTFSINGLTVNYTSVPAVIDDDFPGADFNNGDLVEVKGVNFAGGVLQATKIEPDGLGVGEGGAGGIDDFSQAEIEGFITRFVSPADFDVAGLPVTTTGSTVYEGGTSADLGINVKVEVEGSLNGNGVLVATKVDIRRGNDLRVVALVDAKNETAGTLTVLGVLVRVDANTRFEDKSDADVESFSLAQINVGNYVEVRGGTDTGSADILALIVEREDVPSIPGEDTELRGFVEAVNRPLLTIAGVTVNTSGAVFRNAAGQGISADQFFAAVVPGSLVDADGNETGAASMTALEVEFEN